MKNTIKQTILTLTVGLTAVTANGQSIKDYYIPDAAYNKANFYSTDKTTGERIGMTRVIWYNNKGENYDIVDEHMTDGQIGSVVIKTVQFSSTEVKMIKKISNSVFAKTNTQQDYDPPIILLKMPPAGQTLTWSYIESPGSNDKPTKFISSWTTVTVNGEKKQAIKVVSQYTGMKTKMISYYVKGIGLLKTEMITSAGETIIMDHFDRLEYDETVK